MATACKEDPDIRYHPLRDAVGSTLRGNSRREAILKEETYEENDDRIHNYG